MRTRMSPEEEKLKKKQYYEKNKETILAQMKIKYYEKMKDPNFVKKERKRAKIKSQLVNTGHLREDILAEECALCRGKAPVPWKDNHLLIHHINGEGARYRQKYQKNIDNRPENLITLCRSCHIRLHNAARLFNFDNELLQTLINGLLE